MSLHIFSNLGWLYYGVLKNDGTVMLVNSIGASLQSLYILTYFHYAKEKVGTNTWLAVVYNQSL